MTPKEKYQDIDASASVLPEKAIINLKQLKPILFDKKYQTEEYSDTRKKAEEKMNAMYDKISKDYPDAIKSKVAKQPEPKTPQAMAQKAAKQTIKQPTVKNPKATAGANNRGNVTKLAKEIRKDGETWHAAMKRAGEMINKEKGKAVKKANVQYEKLKAFLAKNPSIEKTMVTYGKKPNQGTRPLDVRRDAARVAKPKGKRVSSEGKTYYEYRANRTDSSRKRYPYLELGGKLFGAGHFAKGGYFKGNEDMFLEIIEKYKTQNGYDDEPMDGDETVTMANVVAKQYGFDAKKKKLFLTFADYNQGNLDDEEVEKIESSYAKGGEFGHTFNGAGKFAQGGYIVEGEDYEYVNTFGIPQEDFIMFVDAWHKNETSISRQAEKEYFDILKSLEDKYGVDMITDIIIYVEDTHDSNSEVGKLVQELGHLEAAYEAESSEDYRKDILRQIRFINNELKQLGAEYYASRYVDFAKGGKTNNGHDLPNTVEEYFSAMNNFSMKLGEAEANFANDNGASYQKLLAERDEFFEKVKAKWYAELNEAEGNFAKDGGKSYEAALKKLEDARIRFAKGGKIDVTIDEVRENGEFMDSYMIDESQTVSNAGEQESWLYKGKNYLITVWNSRAVEHYDGQEEIDIDEDYGSYAKGGKTKSKTYKVKIYSSDTPNTFIMEKTFTDEKSAVDYAYSVDDMNDDGLYAHLYGFNSAGNKVVTVKYFNHYDEDKDIELDEDYVKSLPKTKDCTSWQVDFYTASEPKNKLLLSKKVATLRKAASLAYGLTEEPLYSLINNELYEEYEHDYFAKGGKTNNGDNLPNTVEEYFAAMNNFSMRLGEAEANFANDNGASYQRVLAERDEFFEKTKAKWYAELNEAEGNFAKDGGKSYEAALKKLDDARLRFAKGGFIDLTKNKNKAAFTADFNNEFWVLETIFREKHNYLSGISQYLGIDKSLVKEKLDALVKKGWVRVEENTAKPHLNQYYVTEKGKNEYSKDKYWSYDIIKNKVERYKNGELVDIVDVYGFNIYMNGAFRNMNGIYYDSRREATQRAKEIIKLLQDVNYKEPRNFGLFAKGGKVKGRLSDTHKYVPNRMIQEIEVERRGKTSFIDGADILDGVYVRKGVKFAHGGSMPHVHSKKHRNG
jgi:DNA-binding MarR family transcriptional regulator